MHRRGHSISSNGQHSLPRPLLFTSGCPVNTNPVFRRTCAIPFHTQFNSCALQPLKLAHSRLNHENHNSEGNTTQGPQQGKLTRPPQSLQEGMLRVLLSQQEAAKQLETTKRALKAQLLQYMTEK